MGKRYKLLKEVLNFLTGLVIPAGQIFEKINGANTYKSTSGCWYVSETVVLKKDWFEEIKEEPVTEKSFEWSDDLAKEYAAKLMVENSDGIIELNEHLRQFKLSKQLKVSERIGVTEIKVDSFSDHGNWYKFHVAGTALNYFHDIPNDKFPLIKAVLERVLNNEEEINFGNGHQKSALKDAFEAGRRTHYLNNYSFEDYLTTLK